MEILKYIDFIVGIIFTVCYAYQFFYLPIPWLFKRKNTREAQRNSFAILICGRNESAVIGDLLDSIKGQTYDQSLITVFVMADNCTDNTAEVAAEHGAVVYKRFNKQLIGKGYALSELLGHIKEDFPEGFDGYMVFDADNILSPDYIEKMNLTFSQGHDIITSYRNSKNYGTNWISAGYGLWFLRESRYLNQARYILHTSCAVSGTGFMFSRKIAEEVEGWPYHLLTEDIEFSTSQITKGRKIAFCKDAELFDEQPVKFSQSWKQRLRWAKGNFQVFGGYHKELLKGMLHGNFSCYDMAMSIMPAFVLSVVTLLCNVVILIYGIATGVNAVEVLNLVGALLSSVYGTFFMMGAITTVTEWKHIHTSALKKILYVFTFPLFMFTYLPISCVAVFKDCGWQPIEHTMSVKKLEAEDRKTRREDRKLGFVLGFAAALLLFAAMSISNHVLSMGEKKIIDNSQTAELPEIEYVVVFTGESGTDETRESMIKDRIQQGCKVAQKYKNSKLIIMDERTEREKLKEDFNVSEYDEDGNLSNVSYELDDSLDSTYACIRALKDEYSANKIVIVTQECHLSRALYIANELGIEAYGVTVEEADEYEGGLYRECTEALARIRDFTITFIDGMLSSNRASQNVVKPFF